MNINTIIIKPVITEKTTRLSQEKVYAFQVNTDVNKHQVAETIEKLYSVEVDTVRMMTRKGKEKKVGRKMMIKKLADTKIAYIKLKKGTIDLFPQS